MLSTMSKISVPTFLILGAALLSVTTAIPTDPSSNLVPRKVPEGCSRKAQAVSASWRVVIQNDEKFDVGGCGRGFLDNFRGRCGVVDSFSCDSVKEGDRSTTAVMTFDTTLTCQGEDGTEAIRAASGGQKAPPCQG
jgi:hypothetical protein